ncbi:DUF2971 domain-containing protein [Leptospira kmetyi]|uniref:DUF2971 domain-containing protein n=1 Tax=Leptospira kmetyi TaxID=408139 RepID=UPI00108356F8|nr:DUF2971 domain-containing protein [Leptospira kmetyi]TGK34398.1 DUF2971 domain-containing protein [Leptospira kmetyi]
MYRFRNIKYLLDFGELEKQEIYFSDLASLNDPMEGYKKFYWKGDRIVWKNFFKHYIICLEQAFISGMIKDKNENLTIDDIQVFIGFKNLPTNEYRSLINDILYSFFKTEMMEDLIEQISNNEAPASRDEVYFYLRLIHIFALQSIVSAHRAHGLQNDRGKPFPDFPNPIKSYLLAMKLLDNEFSGRKPSMQWLFNLFNGINEELEILFTIGEKVNLENKKQHYLFFEFISDYLVKIDKIAFPESYIACFMADCFNPVAWSHYGDNHKGVALKFKTKLVNGDSCLSLHETVGYNSNGKSIYNKRDYKLENINYSNEYPEMNFFLSLGRLTEGDVVSEWLMDENENKSELHGQIFGENKSDWHKNYWKSYFDSFLIKLKEWEYEKESRIILTDDLSLRIEKNDRKLSYDFSSLEGIVFGLKTPRDVKLKIIRIIENKCKMNKRDEFKFYQMEYDELIGGLKMKDLSRLKFES